jgi:hypothetical protein
MVIFSLLNQEKVGDFIDRRMPTSIPDRDSIELLHQESLDNMIDILENLDGSKVVSASPSGIVHKGRLARMLLQIHSDIGARRLSARL